MKFKRVTTSGETIYREAVTDQDLIYYKNSPRWEPCEDEGGKGEKPKAEKQEIPEAVIEDVPAGEIPDGVTVESMEIEEKTEAAE